MNTYPLSPEGLSAALRSLDLESWEIAEKFKTLGVKGVTANECACAIAVYLGRVIPGASCVYVEATDVRVDGYERDSFGFDIPVMISAALPDGAQDFVQEFDKGEHPELIEGGAA